MHNFELHSNESVCRKSGRLGLEQVKRTYSVLQNLYNKFNIFYKLQISDYGVCYCKNASKWIEVDLDHGSDNDIQKIQIKIDHVKVQGKWIDENW